MSERSYRGFAGPMENWTHQDLVDWMAYQVMLAMSTGRPINSTCFQFPHAAIQWRKLQDAKAAKPKRSRAAIKKD